jgi:hypothetical protein
MKYRRLTLTKLDFYLNGCSSQDIILQSTQRWPLSIVFAIKWPYAISLPFLYDISMLPVTQHWIFPKKSLSKITSILDSVWH